MAKQPSIEELMAQLGGMGYKAPSSYKGYQSGYTSPIAYKQIDLTPYEFKQKDFKTTKKEKKKKKSNVPNLWDVLTGTLGQPGGIVTDYAYHIGDAAKQIGKKNGKNGLQELLDLGRALSPLSVGKRGIVNGSKQQWGNWTDGKWSWGDIPGVGFLHGMDKGWKRGADILSDQAGVKNKYGKVGGGIAIDILADPLTYLTGGASLAGKLGKASEVAEIAKQAKNLGITKKFKDADEFMGAAKATLETKYAKYPNLSNKMVNKKMTDIGESIKTARAKAYNESINKWGFSVPFSNKMAGSVGNISKNSMLYRTEAKLGSNMKHVADDMLKQAAGGDAIKLNQLNTAVKARYGVDTLADLTKTNMDDLAKQIQPFLSSSIRNLPDAKVTENMVSKSMPNEIFNIKTKQGKPLESVKYTKTSVDDIMGQLAKANPKVAKQVEPMIRGLGDLNDIRKFAPEATEMFGEFARKIMKTVKGKKADEVEKAFKQAADILRNVSHNGTITKDADIVFKELDRVVEVFKNGNPSKLKPLKDKEFYKNMAKVNKTPYNEMMNGHTKIGHKMRGKNPFDARTLSTGDKFLDSMGDHISDANSARLGGAAKYNKSLADVSNLIKKNKITDDEMRQVIYHIEKEAPKSLGKNWQASDRVKEVANMVKPIISKMGKEEQKAGVLSSLRKNYFPHAINQSPETRAAMDDFAKRHPELSEFNGLNQGNKFNQSRKSFQTLAQRDNYIQKIEKAIQKETDADTIEVLRSQLDHVADMFDTDVVSALTRRIREGQRAKSIKAMQGELSKFGMMKTIKKGSKEEPPSGLTKLEPDVARKMGLGEGTHYMHKDVLEGVKRVDEMFTNQGMNKAVRQLNAFSDIWRSMVTHYKPSHYVNNVLGNFMTNMAAGVKITDYKAAGKLMEGYRKGTLTPAQMKLMDNAFDDNVMSGGFLHDANRSFQFDTKRGLEKVADKVIDNKVINKMRIAGEKGDDFTRLANYVNGLKKFGNRKKAAQQVREYLFNYNELTNADRHMRTVVPFWNWTKRNIPLQMKLLMEQPKFAMNIERFKNLFNEGQDGEQWQKDSGFKVPLTNYYTGLPSPTHDLNTILNPTSFLGSMNPAAKMLLETSMNKKMFTGAPITYGQNNVAPEDLPAYLAKNFGITGNVYDAATGNKGVAESIINLFKNITPIRE